MKPLTIKKTTFGEGIPKICIPITGRNEHEILNSAGRIAVLPHEVAEWRADYYEDVTDPESIRRILAVLRELLPDTLLLFTFRTKKEGGERPLSDESYLEICRTVAESGLADLLDLELFTGTPKLPAVTQTFPNATLQTFPDTATQTLPDAALLKPIISLAHKRGCHVILSSHDFQKTPPEEELLRRLSLMSDLGTDLAKLAVMPENEQDVLTLLSATRKAADSLSCPVITMSMGRLGAVSRISGKLTGSCLTFGTAGEASAPGQLPAGTLKNILETL